MPRANVLLVDDSPANLLALEAILHDLGHALVRAASGEEALRLLPDRDFAVVLLDVRMPGLNGFETAKLIRSREPSRHTPVIFLTADDDGLPVEQAYALGAVDFLVKPLVPAILRAKVAVFVDLYQKTEQVRLQAERLRQVERREFEGRLAEEDARLRESEARQAAILATALDCIITIDHRGHVLDFNPAAERTFGYRREDVVGREMAGFVIPPPLRDAHREGMARYLATGEGPVLNRRVELTAVRADGSEFPVELAVTRIPAEGPPVFTGYLRDISDRKKAERRHNVRLAVTQILSEAGPADDVTPRVLRAVCEGLGWGAGVFWRVDRDAGVLRCGELWHGPPAPLAGYAGACRDQTFGPGVGLPGRVWSTGTPAWIPDVLADGNFPRAAPAAAAGLRAGFGVPVRLGPDVLGVFEFFSDTLAEPDADLLEMMDTFGVHFGQFLERREAEERLRRSQRELADFVENATVGLHWVGPDGTILWANQAELELLGYAREEYVGHHIAEFHADPATIRDILCRLTNKEVLDNYEARLRCKDGSVRHVVINSNVLWENDRFVHTRCFTRDVTEQRRAFEALREADRRKDQWVMMLAHELRNPLAPLRNGLQLLQSPDADRRAVEQAGRMMDRQVGHLTRIIEDLLDVSRLMRGRVELRPERLDLGRLTRTVLEDQRPTFDRAGVAVEADVPEVPVWVNADPTRLTQVLDNLIQNAAKFTDRGGSVSVRVEADHGRKQAVLAVRDTGVGIGPDLLPRLFEAFAQADTSLERSKGGLGLGLAVVKGLVELHGGTVVARSDGPGRGAEFVVRLPLQPEPAAVTDVPAPAGRAPTRLRVLVVEDNRDSADSLKMLLEVFGYEVSVAYTGPSGVEAAKEWQPDAVVCDIGLPGLDGFGVARALRQHPTTAKARLIAVTGYGGEEDRHKTREAGFDAHLTKPADPTALQDLLAKTGSTG